MRLRSIGYHRAGRRTNADLFQDVDVDGIKISNVVDRLSRGSRGPRSICPLASLNLRRNGIAVLKVQVSEPSVMPWSEPPRIRLSITRTRSQRLLQVWSPPRLSEPGWKSPVALGAATSMTLCSMHVVGADHDGALEACDIVHAHHAVGNSEVAHEIGANTGKVRMSHEVRRA